MKYAPHAIFGLIVAALLVGQRFGFVWAGGDGYRPERGAVVVGMETAYRRGETVRTGPDERLKIRVGTRGVIALDQNSDLVLTRTTDESVVVHLVRGRIYADFPLTVTTNGTRSTIRSGALSVVNYDFIETVSVVPFGASVEITVKPDRSLATETPVNVHETPPVSVVEAGFNPNAGEVDGFYDWATE